MILSPPRRGAVIRYSYLWADEKLKGLDEGRKDRPALVLALAVRTEGGDSEVLALAITHTNPIDVNDAVPIPEAVKRKLGLDAMPSWVVTTEANAFLWPGPDLRPVPGREPTTFIYGYLPDDVLIAAAVSFMANRRRQASKIVGRT